MILNIFVIVACISIALAWGSKARGYGLFSALINLLCAFIAGGVAFAVWEKISSALIGFGSGSSGMIGDLLQNTAWGLGLLAPFVVTMLALRFTLDSLIKANLHFSENSNQLGGIVFGACTAVITVGIVVISVGYMNVSSAFMGYKPISDNGGNLRYANKLWVPVDMLTVKFYEHLSRGTLATDTPLAQYRPNAHVQAGMQRITFKDAGTTALNPDDYNVLGKYVIDAPSSALLTDTFQSRVQGFKYLDGSDPPSQARLEGYIVQFKAGAKEKGGNVAFTPGQASLIIKEANGKSRNVAPVAIVAGTSPGSPFNLYRFRLDNPGIFISSAGGGSTTTFAFEFIIPQDAIPQSLLLKNSRTNVKPSVLGSSRARAYPSVEERDNAIKAEVLFGLFGGADTGPLDPSRHTMVPNSSGVFSGIINTARLPLGIIFNRSNRGSLQVTSDGAIVSGTHQLTKDATKERGLAQSLKVDTLAASRDTGIVQLTLSQNGTRSQFGQVLENENLNQSITIVDSRGSRYDAVGFIYAEGDIIRIRYNPGRPIATLAEAPTLTQTKQDQSLVLLFRPTKGVQIVSIALGNSELFRLSDGGFSVR